MYGQYRRYTYITSSLTALSYIDHLQCYLLIAISKSALTSLNFSRFHFTLARRLLVLLISTFKSIRSSLFKKSLIIFRLNAQNLTPGRSNIPPGIASVASPLHVQPGEDDQDEHRGNGQHARTGQTGQRQNPHCLYL